MIEWEASKISLSENLEGIFLRLCASVVNVGINNAQQFVQIQVESENFTAQGILVSLLCVRKYKLLLIYCSKWGLYPSLRNPNFWIGN